MKSCLDIFHTECIVKWIESDNGYGSCKEDCISCKQFFIVNCPNCRRHLFHDGERPDPMEEYEESSESSLVDQNGHEAPSSRVELDDQDGRETRISRSPLQNEQGNLGAVSTPHEHRSPSPVGSWPRQSNPHSPRYNDRAAANPYGDPYGRPSRRGDRSSRRSSRATANRSARSHGLNRSGQTQEPDRQVRPTTSLNVDHGSNLIVSGGSNLNIGRRSSLNVDHDSNVNINHGSNVNINHSSNVNVIYGRAGRRS